MKTMQGYTAIATYTQHQGRMYHQADTQHRGPSVSLQAFHQGQRPPPLVEMYATPDTLRLVVERQQAIRTGQVPEAPPPPRPTVNHLACQACGHVTCRCGVPSMADLGTRILTLQRQQGKRP
jgi:hypothetical protein